MYSNHLTLAGLEVAALPFCVEPADVTAVIFRTQLIFMISEKCLYPSRNKLLLAIVVSVVH